MPPSYDLIYSSKHSKHSHIPTMVSYSHHSSFSSDNQLIGSNSSNCSRTNTNRTRCNAVRKLPHSCGHFWSPSSPVMWHLTRTPLCYWNLSSSSVAVLRYLVEVSLFLSICLSLDSRRAPRQTYPSGVIFLTTFPLLCITFHLVGPLDVENLA